MLLRSAHAATLLAPSAALPSFAIPDHLALDMRQAPHVSYTPSFTDVCIAGGRPTHCMSDAVTCLWDSCDSH